MCKFNVFGINAAALKRQLKEDRKTNRPGAGWSEENGSTYYTNGYFILKLNGLTFQGAALLLGLGYEDTPGDSDKNLERIWASFNPNDYTPARVTKWCKDYLKIGAKKPITTRVVVNDTGACLIQQSFLDVFDGGIITMRARNSGIRIEHGDMEAYILPVNPTNEEYNVMRAICCNERED